MVNKFLLFSLAEVKGSFRPWSIVKPSSFAFLERCNDLLYKIHELKIQLAFSLSRDASIFQSII